MKKLVRSGLFLLAGLLVLATSCNQMNDSEKGGKGTVVLQLTDAPFPVSLVDQALVTIDKIEIRSSAAVSAPGGTGENEALFTVLYEGEGKEFNLLDLRNGVTTELLSMDIATGSYDLIRMHVAKAEVVLKDGTSFDLKIPSGATSGIKMKIVPELVVEDGVQSEILLDFDVSKSFVVQGNLHSPHGVKGFLFKPVLRAVCQKHGGVVAGKVFESGTTTPIAEAHVQILRADTVYSSAITSGTGAYALIGIPAGTYKMVCEKEGYTSVQVDEVVVKAREKTQVNFDLVKTVPVTTP